MKFILLFGPPAVGKMSVGQELAKQTGLKLFHNHMTIELVVPFFDFGTTNFKYLVNLFREEIFKKVATSDLKGLIFTYVWAFDKPEDRAYVEKVFSMFKDVGAEIYVVELQAALDERLKRNKTELRLQHKPTKRNTDVSEDMLLQHEQEHRFSSNEGEITADHYIKIDTTNLSVQETVHRIVKEFEF